MKLGVMQPYLFPYLGYFQLINAVDLYIVSGDFQYIKRGWINRNLLLANNNTDKTSFFSFEVKKDNHLKKINEREYCNLEANKKKLLERCKNLYSNSANYSEGISVLKTILDYKETNIELYNYNSICKVAEYLGIKTKIVLLNEYEKSPEFWKHFNEDGTEERIINLCKYLNADTYINAIGGMNLYSKKNFGDAGIDLQFLKMNTEELTTLSVIDIIMRYKPSQYSDLLGMYEII